MTKKYSFIVEGQTENSAINFIKSKIFNLKKLELCKKHSKCKKGTITSKDIESSKGCCKQFVVMDKDSLSNNEINNIRKKCNDSNIDCLISIPCFEIILVSFFKEINREMSIAELETIIKKIINDNQIKKELTKIEFADFVLNKFKDDINNLNQWKRRLKNLKKLNITNFIDLIDFFETFK